MLVVVIIRVAEGVVGLLVVAALVGNSVGDSVDSAVVGDAIVGWLVVSEIIGKAVGDFVGSIVVGEMVGEEVGNFVGLLVVGGNDNGRLVVDALVGDSVDFVGLELVRMNLDGRFVDGAIVGKAVATEGDVVGDLLGFDVPNEVAIPD